ncbi:hypothetical protein [Solimonas marina]|uniref:Uncharacterized protein n=1 Tax=Solimonas marina TaxID=2714601 RepID=A0A970B5C9_9GAMM|nr:hypothetical protein [Solimonas marina]NKF23272.1 hypothetical protein [Solimonas marina]
MTLASTPAWAQSNTAASVSASDMKGFAAPALQAPVAFGARWGTFGAGFYGQSCDCNQDNADGSLGVAFGLGDPDKYAALEVSVASSSLFGDTGSGDSFGESGSVGLKLHTNMPGYASFAIGVNGTGRWGSDQFKNANRASVYAVATKMVPVGQYAAILNIGMGNELYNEPGKDKPGVFGSAAFYFTQQISVLAEYTGRFTNAALSVAPLRSFPLTVTLGATNLGERYGQNVEFAGSVGVGFAFNTL